MKKLFFLLLLLPLCGFAVPSHFSNFGHPIRISPCTKTIFANIYLGRPVICYLNPSSGFPQYVNFSFSVPYVPAYDGGKQVVDKGSHFQFQNQTGNGSTPAALIITNLGTAPGACKSHDDIIGHCMYF